MILNNDRELIRDFAAIASMKLDNVVMVINLLTFNFKLALFGMILEVNKESDDTSEKHRSNSSTGDAGSFKHNT